MKKILLLLIPALLFTFAGCKKDKENEDEKKDNVDVNNPPNAKSVIMYFGGTWCPPCGANGKPAMDAAKNEFGENSIYLSVGLNSGNTKDPMNNPSGQSLRNMFGSAITGVPSVFVGGPNALSKVPTNASGVINKAKEENGSKALAYGKPSVKVTGNKVDVDVDITFFEDHSDEYRCVVYLTEDDLTHKQSSDARPADRKDKHDGVIRLTIPNATTPTGDMIAASVKKGQKVKFSASGTLEDGWKKENMKAVVVFWKKVGNGFAAVGGEFTKF